MGSPPLEFEGFRELLLGLFLWQFRHQSRKNQEKTAPVM
jgi:hypothetical protein